MSKKDLTAQMDELESAHARLAQAGLRPTLVRLVVLRILEQVAPECLDAKQIFCCVIQRAQTVGSMTFSLATVYRTLSHLEQHGIVLRVRSEGGAMLYRLKPQKTAEKADMLISPCGSRVEFLNDAKLHDAICEAAQAQGFHDISSLTIMLESCQVPDTSA